LTIKLSIVIVEIFSWFGICPLFGFTLRKTWNKVVRGSCLARKKTKQRIEDEFVSKN